MLELHTTNFASSFWRFREQEKLPAEDFVRYLVKARRPGRKSAHNPDPHYRLLVLRILQSQDVLASVEQKMTHIYTESKLKRGTLKMGAYHHCKYTDIDGESAI